MELLGLVYCNEEKIEQFFSLSKNISKFMLKDNDLTIEYGMENNEIYQNINTLNIIIEKNNLEKLMVIEKFKQGFVKILSKENNRVYLNEQLILKLHSEEIIITSEMIKKNSSVKEIVIDKTKELMKIQNLLKSNLLKHYLNLQDVYLTSENLYVDKLGTETLNTNNTIIWNMLYEELLVVEETGKDIFDYNYEYKAFLKNFIIGNVINDLDKEFKYGILMRDVEKINSELDENEILTTGVLNSILENEEYNILNKPKSYLNEFRSKYIFFNALSDKLIILMNNIKGNGIYLSELIGILEESNLYFSNSYTKEQKNSDVILRIIYDVFIVYLENTKLLSNGLDSEIYTYIETLLKLENGCTLLENCDDTLVLLDNLDLYLDLEEQRNLISKIDKLNFKNKVNILLVTHSPAIATNFSPYFIHEQINTAILATPVSVKVDNYKNEIHLKIRDLEKSFDDKISQNYNQIEESAIKICEKYDKKNKILKKEILEVIIPKINDILSDSTPVIKEDSENSEFLILDPGNFSSKKYVQKIYAGVPGCGKSYKVSLDTEGTKVFRVTFFPEYENHNFIGTILPKVENGTPIYKFVPGPFTKALKYAYNNPEELVSLVIEELTRGNTSAIFGEIFQLLDRSDDGWSEYPVDNENIFNEIGIKVPGKHTLDGISLPPNFSIYGTLNTSDQNVFALDSAFRRRFNYNYISIENSILETDFEIKYANTYISWNKFYRLTNKFIVKNLGMTEDKQIGPYVIKDRFEIKSVLSFLYTDVHNASFTSTKLFKNNIKTQDKLLNSFTTSQVFCDELHNQLLEEE